MPESKHRRQRSKRASSAKATPPKPKRSPRWVPYGGVGLIAVGAVTVIVSYVGAIANWPVLAGFVLMGAGLVILSQLR